MVISWWHWLVVGLVLVLLEMAASGGFYVVFFGVAAIAIGSLRLLGLSDELWLELLLFSLISVGSLLLFRGRLIRWLRLDQVPQQADAVIHLKQRARQADGTPVDTAWGAGRQRIAGCTGDGGPVQIG